MKIEVFGTGCPKCRKTGELIEETIRKLGVEAEVVHVTDLNEIIDRGIMITPAVAVDGVVKLEGKIPDEKTIGTWLQK